MRRYLTPPQIAKRLGVEVAKVRAWIRAGELKAMNAAVDVRGKKPRFKINPDEFEKFEAMRPAASVTPRKRRTKAVVSNDEPGNWF